MILECPNCDTHYEIPVELPPEGRKVRCASCQNIWLALPVEENAEAEAAPPTADEAATAQDAPAADEAITAEEMVEPVAATGDAVSAEVAAFENFQDEEIVFEDDDLPATEEASDDDFPAIVEASDEDDASPVPEIAAETDAEDSALSDAELADAFSTAVAEAGLAEPEEEPESPPIVIGKARKKKSLSLPTNLAAGWAALGLAIAATAGVGYFQRVNVVRVLPGAAASYARIGLPVNVRGLAFEDVKYSWETSAGRPVLAVNGEIVNVTSTPLKVPTVVFGLRTKERVEVYQWAADVRTDLLPPGERTAFTAEIPTPPKSIRDVQVRFAKVQ